ncbi:hypothetical protein A8F94_14185 [Bacillus sp. FJAT-27225]|uniref:N-acetylglucosamine kinase n=1 Tax=Bacillus sp. FJAT-27225 TaxID=1743144 RepID=UPI00080C2C53|nr:BadF/BadG/BcrA/BcrD ATPase family protein [Bacillus sp. FJAT-27225]OCA85990.1 hypothetical protein A8F94_14185 [Bacillus sp. FJAT-27225]
MFVLGIDGGGTKTKGVIANSNGEIIAEAISGASNPNSVSHDELEIELSKLIDSLKKQSDNLFSQVKTVYAGMSGVDHPSARKEMQDILTSLLPKGVNVTVNNDAITALYSGTLGKPGIIQIAGTGSVTYGLNDRGIFDRVGGWGYLLGEKGSGYSLGSEGLRAAFLEHDGLGKSTIIKELIVEHFQVQSLPDLVHTVYQSKNSKELIASLSKLVVKAADLGDRVAMKIIEKNGLYVGESISCLINRLFSTTEKQMGINIVFTGGLFNRLDLFQNSIEDVLSENRINYTIVIPEIPPVGGAIIAALLEEKIKIDDSFIEFFNRYIKC